MKKPFYERRKGCQIPTIFIAKDGGVNLYDSTVAGNSIKRWMSEPFPWQELVLRTILTIDEYGNFQYKTVCLSVPRRNGKTEIIIATMLTMAILMGAKVLYTAQIQDTANDIYGRFMDLIESGKSNLGDYFRGLERHSRADDLVIQAKHPTTGKLLGTLEFKGRKGSKGRGITRDVIIIDEAQDYDAEQEQRFGSINGSSQIGMTLLVGTPPPLDTKTDATASGVVFRQLREEALVERDLPWANRQKKGTAWIEWGADSVKSKMDKDAWYRCNPSMGYLPGNALSEDWFANRPSSTEVFSVENLGYWTTQSKDRAFDISTFNQLAITPKELHASVVGCKFSLAIKSDPQERAIYVGAAFRRKDEKIAYQHLMTIFPEDENWDKKLEAYVVDLAKRNSCLAVYVDGSLATSALIPAFIKAYLWNPRGNRSTQGKIRLAGMVDIAKSCADLLTSISAKRLVHSSPPPLHDAAEDSKKRKIGETGFGFQSISGMVDVVPLEVCALAIHGVELYAQPKSSRDMSGRTSSIANSLGAL